MVTGFSEYTHELSDYEKTVLLPLLLKGFASKVGAGNAVTNKQIVSALKAKGHTINDARVRKLVNHIRTQGLIPGLIATSKGYYITDDITELVKYADSLNQRSREIKRVAAAMTAYINTLLKKAS